MNRFVELLKQHQSSFQSVLPEALQFGQAVVLDMNSEYWSDAASVSVATLIERTQALLKKANAVMAIGQYAENREKLYRRSPVFSNTEEPRSLHLGMDLTVPAGTPVFSPYVATVHSFACHNELGDYGPTLILAHTFDETTFYTLYGHLSVDNLSTWQVGQAIQAGEQIAIVGTEKENGHWPPHLHFQIIQDLEGWIGSYPGVVSLSEAEKYLANCPDPNLILGLDL